MGADSLANMEWLFGMFEKVSDFLIVSTAPLMIILGQAINQWIESISYIAIGLLFYRIFTDGPIKAIFVTSGILLIVVWGLQPATIVLSGGSTVQATYVQRVGYTLVMSINKSINGAISKVGASLSTDGAFIPTAALIDYSVERTANQYKNSDLGRLIRDYNAQCSPKPNMLTKGTGNATIEDYHAVGLLGGSGLGIPEDQISRLAQLKILGNGAVSIATALGPWSSSTSSGDVVSKFLDAGAARSRRANGLAALENIDSPFVPTKPYMLPTSDYWIGLMNGKADTQPSYLSISAAPSDIQDALEKNVGSWYPDEGGAAASLNYNPGTCVEAYKVAQFAAEQAYKGLVETGDMKASGGQSSTTEAGALAAARSWMRVQEATLAGGDDKQPGVVNSMLSGTIASWQMGKNFLQWFDLQTLLPLYVAGMAGLFWLTLMAGPIAILLLPLRGSHGATLWLSMLIFPMLCVCFVHLIAVAASITMKSVALAQAAAAAGWQGGGADLDLVYGSLQMVFGVLLALGTWIATKLTGVVVGPLGGAARGSVVTGQEAIKSTYDAGKLIATKGAAIQGNSAGGGGGGPRGSISTQKSASKHTRLSTQTQSSSSYSSSGSTAQTPSSIRPINLVPLRASNDDSKGKRRTPRSEKNLNKPGKGDE